jgi:hypothetical protein
MKTIINIVCAALLSAAFSSSTRAASPTVAWGTISGGSNASGIAQSAQLHENLAATAQAVSQGNDQSFKSVTTCGTCVTISIQGNGNEVAGNTIVSTNSGSQTATVNFGR